MADETTETDFFQKLLQLALDIFEPVLEVFEDEAAKEELLGSLGLKPTVDIGSLPARNNLEAYVQAQAEDVDEVMLFGALADFTQLTMAVEGMIRLGLEAGDAGESHAVDELFGTLFNVLLMERVRRKSPEIYALARLLVTINENTAKVGGNIAFGAMVKDFFAPVFEDGLDTAEGARGISAFLLVLVGGTLFLIDHFVLKKRKIDNIDLKLGYGYEGITDSLTPIADAITDRALTYSITARPVDDPDNQGTVFNTLTLVPREHGGAAVVTGLSGEIDITIPINEDMSLKLDIGGDGIFRIGEGAGAAPGPNNRLGITLKHKLGQGDSLRLTHNPEIKTGLKEYSFAITIKPDDFDIKVKSKLPFLMKRKKDAGFPMSMLPEQIKEEIPLDFGYSLKNDFYFGNGGGNPGTADTAEQEASPGATDEEANFLENLAAKLLNKIDIRVPVHKVYGDVLGLQMVNVKTSVQGNFKTITLETSIDFWLKFGSPLTLSISRLGAKADLEKSDDNAVILGREIALDLKQPTGAGIAVNAGPVAGGGFLYYDEQKGEYFGAVELSFKGLFDLNAVGIITTKIADDTEGVSLLVLVTAEFQPISLAFGFTLDGVGGLLGLNRTAEVEALRIGVRTNAIKSILFPEDVVANISRIVSDLNDLFPSAQDRFVVGLMAKIGYAGSNIVSIELGVVLELPDPRVLILGVVKVVAPDEEAEALRLQVNFLGILDFPNEFAYLEAHLYESHVVGFPLTGSLALVAGWGDNGMFAVSVGGFHPDFSDYPSVPTLPGAFRNMTRVGFSLLKGDNPTLTVECYFALTSNSLQFGAKVELLAKGPMSFNLYGILAFDALFIFDPFSFVIRLEATLAIRRKRSVLFGISFKGELSGTNPWHIAGEVTFGLLFFDISIGFDETWGDELEAIAAETADLVGMVRSELRDERNWRPVIGPNLHHTVTHRPLDDLSGDEIVIYPFGDLSFSQRQLPLNYDIEKLGTQRPLNEKRIGIARVRLADTVQTIEAEKELFAAGQFTRLSEREKLTRKSFERFDSGFTLKDTGKLATVKPDLDPVELNYELNYTDDDEQQVVIAPLSIRAFQMMKRKAAVAKAELGWGKSAGSVLNAVQAVSMPEQVFSIAKTSDLREFDAALRTSTMSEAKAALEALVANDPDLGDELQIVYSHELAG